MVDMSFEWTESLNKYLGAHVDVKNRYLIYASFLMDLMILTVMAVFYLYWKGYRIIFGYLIFFGTRTFIQVSPFQLMQ